MKYIKNDTLSDIYIQELGFNLPAGYNHQIALAELVAWQYANEIITEINNENLVVNDGTTFYTVPSEGIDFLRN